MFGIVRKGDPGEIGASEFVACLLFVRKLGSMLLIQAVCLEYFKMYKVML